MIVETEMNAEEKVKCAILRILNLNSLRLFGCVLYNFKIHLFQNENILNVMEITVDIDNNKINTVNRLLTANVLVDNGKPTINLYSSFVNEHNISELIFIIIHEITHFINGDCMFNGDGLDSVTLNIAKDHIINKSIKKDISNKILDPNKISVPSDALIIPEIEHKNLSVKEVYDYIVQKRIIESTEEISFNPNQDPNCDNNKNNSQDSENSQPDCSGNNSSNSQESSDKEDSKDDKSESKEKDDKDINKSEDTTKDEEKSDKEESEEDKEESDDNKKEDNKPNQNDIKPDETPEPINEEDEDQVEDNEKIIELTDEVIEDNLDDYKDDIQEDEDSDLYEELKEQFKTTLVEIKIKGTYEQILTDVSQSDSTESKLLTLQIQSEVRSVIDNVLTPQQKGNYSGSLFELIERATQVKIPWEKLLDRSICSKIIADEDNRSWGRIKKRPMAMNLMFPGDDDEEKPEYLIISVDTSGSISTDELKKFSSVMIQSCKYFDFVRIIQHDYRITSDITVESQFLLSEDIFCKFNGRGGTSHKYVFEKIQEMFEMENIEVSLYIMLTDFYSDIKEIWGSYEWTKHIPICVCIPEQYENITKLVPSYIDPNPIQIDK